MSERACKFWQSEQASKLNRQWLLITQSEWASEQAEKYTHILAEWASEQTEKYMHVLPEWASKQAKIQG